MPLAERDHLDIQMLMAQFIYCLDAGDAEGWLNTFAPHGTYIDNTHRAAGHDAIRLIIEQDVKTGAAGPHHQPRLLHLHTPPRIEGDGDRATAYSYWQAVAQAKDGSVVIWRVGEFRDRLVKLDGRWLFEERNIPGLLGKRTLAEL